MIWVLYYLNGKTWFVDTKSENVEEIVLRSHWLGRMGVRSVKVEREGDIDVN